MRTIQLGTEYAAWLMEAQKRAVESKDPDDWRAYRNLRNIATAILNAEGREWEKQGFPNYQFLAPPHPAPRPPTPPRPRCVKKLAYYWLK